MRGWAFLLWMGSLLLTAASAVAQQRPAAPPAPKLAPALRPALEARTRLPRRYALRVQVRDTAAFRQWALRALPGARMRPEPHQRQLLTLADVGRAQLPLLLASDLVTFVDVPNRTAHDERQLNQADLTVNSVTPVHRQYPGLAGQGLTVSVKENPLDAADVDFRGRLVDVDSGAATVSAHATIMATLIAGGGNSAPAGRGVAWQARITSADYANLLPDDPAELQQRAVSVQNHSYGTGIENYYGLEAQAYDEQARQVPTLLHVFSSGNSGDDTSPSGPYQGLPGVANLTGQFKMSKNSLSVGATDALGQVAPLSSRGPSYDGRLKPELVAFGDGGSSDAAALVSGMSLLVQQAYRDQHGGTLPPAALVKAALLNSALDTGPPGPDFAAGFGQANALGAVRTLLGQHYHTAAVAQGQEQVIQLTVPAGTPQLKATLVWTDTAAAANAAQALVNDLDMVLVHVATGVRWQPWVLSAVAHPDSLALPARRGPDHLNNAEQITLAAPPAGLYELRVSGYAVPGGVQEFSVAYELGSGFEWLTPSAERNVRPAESSLLRWNWDGPAAAGQLHYRLVGSATWQPIGQVPDLRARSFPWVAPDTTALAVLRLNTGGSSYLSDTVVLARPLPLGIGYVCSEEALLYWPAVPGAASYQLYRLGATQLEPLLQTPDTLQVLEGPLLAAGLYAVAPVLGTQVAERSSSGNLRTAGLNCYIRSFVARQAAADTVQLLVELGSTFRLQAVQLQRLQPDGSYGTISTLQPVTRLQFTLTDSTAAVGLNQYRLAVQDASGRLFYSQTESAYLVRPAEVLVFPVPAEAGAPVSIIGPPDVPLQLRLYDMLGRLLHESTANGTINYLSTEGLRPGTYLLHVQPENGPKSIQRIVVF